MKKNLFDNSNLQEEIVWGNIPVSGMTDEELHSTNWNLKKTEADKEKLRIANTLAAQRPEVQLRNREGQQKRKGTGWSKKMIGNTNGANGNGFTGRKHNPESIELIRQQALNRDHSTITGVPKERLTCPHCGKEGGRPQMYQWHFDRCKHKPQ